MLIEEVDPIGLQPLKRGLGDFFDVLGAAVQASLLAVLDLEAEFCGDCYLITKRRKRFAGEFFVGERTVDFRGVEECDAALDCRANNRNAVLFVNSGAIAKAQSHTAESDG